MAGNGSGDIFIAFTTANPGCARPKDQLATLTMLPNDNLDTLFWSVAYATEEAILNSLFRAETVRGPRGTVGALPLDSVTTILREYRVIR